MASTNNGISGLAVAVLATGGILIWSGINNQDMITSLRHLAMGQPIPEGPQVYKAGARDHITGDGNKVPRPGMGNPQVVAIAASYEGTPYIFGGGHGKVCGSKLGMDCSGYVSCVLNKAGLMKGTLTTDGFAKWGSNVGFQNRMPGDIVVWVGGPAGGHMGIIADDDTMWHSPCTGCGGVQKAKYGATRGGRPTLVRRAKSSG